MAASFGKVRLDCPICRRPFDVHFDLDTSDSGKHLLTHGQHDGEPLDKAA